MGAQRLTLVDALNLALNVMFTRVSSVSMLTAKHICKCIQDGTIPSYIARQQTSCGQTA